jgi:hypothetical protein
LCVVQGSPEVNAQPCSPVPFWYALSRCQFVVEDIYWAPEWVEVSDQIQARRPERTKGESSGAIQGRRTNASASSRRRQRGNDRSTGRRRNINDDGAGEEPITVGQPADPSETQTQDHQPANETTTVRKWSKRHKPTQRLIESQEQESARYAAYISKNREVFDENSDTNDYDQDVYHGVEEYEIQRQMSDPSVAFAVSSDPDIMYLHEAMK